MKTPLALPSRKRPMPPPLSSTDNSIRVGDCVEVMAAMPENSISAIVTDPPYGLEFMGKEWDTLGDASHRHAGVDRSGLGVPRFGSYMPVSDEKAIEKLLTHRLTMQTWHEQWARAASRVLKPGGHLVAFGGTRTHHRLMCALEDAGFEIRDTLMWPYGQGFPKSLDVSKAIDARSNAQGLRRVVSAGSGVRPPRSATSFTMMEGGGGDRTAPALDDAEKWQGWGTALKPAWEPIILARKPLSEPTAANVLRWGTGALNIDGCRVGVSGGTRATGPVPNNNIYGEKMGGQPFETAGGRWPANVALTHSPECELTGVKRVKAAGSSVSGNEPSLPAKNIYGKFNERRPFQAHADADGKEEVEDWCCALDCPVAILDAQSGSKDGGGSVKIAAGGKNRKESQSLRAGSGMNVPGKENVGVRDFGDSGGASRFFYCSKASSSERWGYCRTCAAAFPHDQVSSHTRPEHDPVFHPTVKPVALMRWLLRLVTPPNGLVLDPFCGSGTTLVAGTLEGVSVIGIERDPDYAALARARIISA